MKRFSIFLILLIFSCTQTKPRTQISVGIDPSLPQIQSLELRINVIGFIKDMLNEIPSINFYFINDDTTELPEGLIRKKYDIIFSMLTPYNFNEQDYNFSEIVIPLAPYPIIRKNEKIKNLSDFRNKIIGVQEADLGLIDFQRSEDWNLKIYDFELNALNDLVNNTIDVALMRYLDALSYVEDTFYDQLEMLDIPLNNQGYRFTSLKDHHSNIIKLLNGKLKDVKKNDALIKKWDLKLQN